MTIYEFAPKEKHEHVWITEGDTFLTNDGCFVEIKWDYDCTSPRKYDNLGTFYTWMNSYGSPDKAPTLEELFSEYDLWDEWEDRDGRCNPVAWFAAKLNELGHVALPVSAYVHGGVAYAVGTPSQFPDSQWDAGYAGVIYVDAEKVCSDDWCSYIHEITPETRKVINRYLADEVEYFDEWAQGHCYGYIMYDRNGDEVESCWGFIGDDLKVNGIEDYIGELESTSLTLDEWVELNETVSKAANELLDGMTAEYEGYAA